MSPYRWIAMAAVWLLAIGFGSAPARPHDLPLDRFMNGFVRIGPHQADLVIRVPLDLLRAVPFPLVHGDYDLAASSPAVKTAVNALSRDLALWEDRLRLLPVKSEGRLAPLDDRSFEGYERAAAGVATALPPDTRIGYELGYLDAHFVYPIGSPHSVFAIDSVIGADLGDTVKLAIRFIPLDGASRALMITGGAGRVALDPAWWEAALGFVRLGIEHILSGIDHLLFLLCLVIPFRRIKPLVPVISAFTLGHSITLIGTAYNLAPAGAWFPPFVEAAIAASIFYMAIENIVGANLRRRWIIAALFGLVHGFGFADVLREQLQFAGSYLLVSLVSFNIGIEIGQLAVLCVFVPALALLFRGAMAGRMGVIVLSAIVAHVAWHWMMERGEVLWRTPWPQPTTAGLMLLARWVLALGLAVAAANFLSKWLERRRPPLAAPTGLPARD
ncbi:MAG: HupE/UreJ family protein [Stellaceae bacterium]